MVIEVFEEEKRFESEKDATVDCRLPLNGWHFKVLPKIMAAKDFSTDSPTLIVPFVGSFVLFKPSSSIVLLI
jgi:hypothetical protein